MSSQTTVKDLCDKLLDNNGIEPFLVWADVVGYSEARRIFSEFASRILQSLPSLRPDTLKSGEWLDLQAMIFRKFGDLCLVHNFMTPTAARSCLDVALLDLSRYGHELTLADVDRESAWIRYYEALGVMISKLACSLKSRKSYNYLAKTSEMKLAKKLKNL